MTFDEYWVSEMKAVGATDFKRESLFYALAKRAWDAATEAALAQQPAAVDGLAARLVDELDGLVSESEGVSGLHLNGDVASWDELLPGGRFERLSSLDELREALVTQQPAAVDGEVVAWMRRTATYRGVDGRSEGERIVSEQQVYPDDIPLYTAPPSAPLGVDGLVRDLVCEIERNTCTHEETHRGGVLWEICDLCGAKWADDRGGRPEFQWPDCVERAREWLSQQPAAVGVKGLPRYGFPDGNEPRPVPCADGYWTPWHLAQQAAAMAEADKKEARRYRALVATGKYVPAMQGWGLACGSARASKAELDAAADALTAPPGGSDAQQLSDHHAITHCDNCGCDWPDNGLNSFDCPNCKPPAAKDDEGNWGAWRTLWLVLRQTGPVAVPPYDIVSVDWSKCQIEQTVQQLTGAVQLRATLLAAQRGGWSDMSLVHYEVAYHLIDSPNKTHNIRLLTGEDPALVDEYLLRQHGHGRVVLHYAEREPEPVGRERTCGYCGCTRIEYESRPRPLHPAATDKSLWRTL